jgi:hypothetical protein
MASSDEIQFDHDYSAPALPVMVLTPAQCGALENIHQHTAAHDQQVLELVNQTIATFPHSWNSVAGNLDLAQANITEARRTNGSDTVMRDAEYYLKVRAWAADHKSQSVKFVVGGSLVGAALVWNGLKYVVDPFAPGFTQSNKGNPNATPGGMRWAIKGANDALMDWGSQMGQARPAMLDPADQ